MSLHRLTLEQRQHCERLFVRAAEHLIAHPDRIDYTQGADRWDGINHRRRSYRGNYPRWGDCSSTGTWLVWDATRRFRVPDVVNGENWDGGYTGTILDHGVRVTTARYKIMDAAVYGPGTGSHVVWYIGNGWWFSHGSDEGPYRVRLHYRADLQQVRRHIA